MDQPRACEAGGGGGGVGLEDPAMGGGGGQLPFTSSRVQDFTFQVWTLLLVQFESY